MKKMMKGALLVLVSAMLTAGLALGAASCGAGGSSSPSAVVKNFYAAAEKGDLAAIDKTCTPDTASLMKAFVGEEKFKTQMAENGKITNTVETIDGDTATVVVSFANADDETINLVKVDGKWKVSVEK